MFRFKKIAESTLWIIYSCHCKCKTTCKKSHGHKCSGSEDNILNLRAWVLKCAIDRFLGCKMAGVILWMLSHLHILLSFLYYCCWHIQFLVCNYYFVCTLYLMSVILVKLSQQIAWEKLGQWQTRPIWWMGNKPDVFRIFVFFKAEMFYLYIYLVHVLVFWIF